METDVERLISIIIPVYNVEKHLRKCLDSVIGQTYRNIEVILVNDASTDLSGNICDEYALQDARIQVIHLEKNRGVSSARNVGIDRAKGSAVSFVDADDHIESSMIELLYKSLLENQADVSICVWEQIGFGKYASLWQIGSVCVLSGEEAISCMICRVPFNHGIGGKLFAYEAIKERRFSEKIHCGEDILFLYELFKQVKRVSYIPNKLYYYVYRKDSATHREFCLEQYTEFYVYEYIYKDISENNPQLIPVIQQKILDINGRIAVKAVESKAIGCKTLYGYLKRLQKNVRQYMSAKALGLFKFKKIAAEIILLYCSAELFWIVTFGYKKAKGFLIGERCGAGE